MKTILKLFISSCIIISNTVLITSCNNSSNIKIINFYVIGDSLSDTGAGVNGMGLYIKYNKGTKNGFNMIEPYYLNRTWCNGSVACELIAKKLNLSFNPAWEFTEAKNKIFSSHNGQNYAVGGEVIDSSSTTNVIKTFDFQHQVKMLLNQHYLTNKDVIWIEIGANDVFRLISENAKNLDWKIVDQSIDKIITIFNNGLKDLIDLLHN